MAAIIGMLLFVGIGYCCITSIYHLGKATGSRKAYHVGRSHGRRR